MNVLDAHEQHLTVLIRFRRFVSLALCFVCDRINLRTSVHDQERFFIIVVIPKDKKTTKIF